MTPEEKAAIDRLAALGFPERVAAEAYLVCGKNEELAANFLFENGTPTGRPCQWGKWRRGEGGVSKGALEGGVGPGPNPAMGDGWSGGEVPAPPRSGASILKTPSPTKGGGVHAEPWEGSSAVVHPPRTHPSRARRDGRGRWRPLRDVKEGALPHRWHPAPPPPAPDGAPSIELPPPPPHKVVGHGAVGGMDFDDGAGGDEAEEGH